jgi:hypothetical protein
MTGEFYLQHGSRGSREPDKMRLGTANVNEVESMNHGEELVHRFDQWNISRLAFSDRTLVNPANVDLLADVASVTDAEEQEC